MIDFFKEALQVYQKENNGTLPQIILMYRDGCGGPTLLEKVHSYEVENIQEFLENYT